MKLFNQFLSKTVPLMPKFFVGLVAKKYVAGVTLEKAVRKIKELNEEGFLATTDVLGENIPNLEAAQKPLAAYLELLETIDRQQLNTGISVKLSQLGLNLNEEKAWENFDKVLQKAKELDIFVRLDMEDSPWTDKTIGFYRRAREIYAKTGTVIQSYLFRSEKDIKELIFDGPTNLRICKGIYKEDDSISYQEKQEISDNFFRLVKLCLENDSYVGIATHDLDLIARCEEFITSQNISRDKYEFQALLGVPVKKTLERLAAAGHQVRYYVPFGSDWYPYSMRRLKENPDIAGYIFKDFFKIGND